MLPQLCCLLCYYRARKPHWSQTDAVPMVLGFLNCELIKLFLPCNVPRIGYFVIVTQNRLRQHINILFLHIFIINELKNTQNYFSFCILKSGVSLNGKKNLLNSQHLKWSKNKNIPINPRIAFNHQNSNSCNYMGT